MQQNKSTLIGTLAILMWSALALLTVLCNEIPPFELLAISFSIAFCIGVVMWIREGKESLRHLKQPLWIWTVGVGGLFGYHLFYFLGIKNAPALQANLINYLWPLLIVFLSAFLPNEKLRWFHIVGGLCGFLGAGLLIFSKNGDGALVLNFSIGYIYAFLGALAWSSYSVISRTFAYVPTSVVGGFCAVVALFAWILHFLFEKSIIPNAVELFAAILLGLGPVGGAFFVWDVGMKQGDIKLLGTLSYAIPLFSTLLLILFGLAQSNFTVWVACGLIILGSIISSKEYLKKPKRD